MELTGREALVTGASGGLGGAIARALHRRGASLVISGRNVEALEALAEELGALVRALPADLGSADDVRSLVERAGSVDVLVSNAGLPASGRYDDFTSEQIDRALDVNLRAPIQLARALAPAMVERGSGHLVFMSSISGKVASNGSSIYSATKFGVRGFAFALREDLRGTGVGVTTVFPGFISEAGMFAESQVKLPSGIGTRSPEDVAGAVLRGIERNRAEIDVATPAQRAGALLGSVAPSVVAAATRRLGGEAVAEALADAQRGKR